MYNRGHAQPAHSNHKQRRGNPMETWWVEKTLASGWQQEEPEQKGANHQPLVEVPVQQRVAGPHTPTSLAEASALEAVACLVCRGHQGLSKAAVGKDGAVRRTAQTGPVAGEITVILGGWAPPIHHGPYGTPQLSANVHMYVCVCFRLCAWMITLFFLYFQNT